jgi:hypothetical protein
MYGALSLVCEIFLGGVGRGGRISTKSYCLGNCIWRMSAEFLAYPNEDVFSFMIILLLFLKCPEVNMGATLPCLTKIARVESSFLKPRTNFECVSKILYRGYTGITGLPKKALQSSSMQLRHTSIQVRHTSIFFCRI